MDSPVAGNVAQKRDVPVFDYFFSTPLDRNVGRAHGEPRGRLSEHAAPPPLLGLRPGEGESGALLLRLARESLFDISLHSLHPSIRAPSGLPRRPGVDLQRSVFLQG